MKVDRFFTVFRTAGKGMAAMRKQLQVSAENIANAYTTKVDGTDEPYKPKKLNTVQNDSQRFRMMFQDSVLQLRNTRNSHLDAESRSIRGNDGTQDLSPDLEIQQVEKYRYEYDPQHPDADENGMVKYPDLDLVEEMTNMITANRLYEANMAVVEAEKQVIKRSFDI